MENLKGKFANNKTFHLDASEIAIAEAAVKKIPVLGAVYSASESVENMLHNAFPSIFDSGASFQANMAAKFDSNVYNNVKDKPLFFIGFTDPKFTIPARVGPGAMFMGAFPDTNDPLYQSFVSTGKIIDGVSSVPSRGTFNTNAPLMYIILPNVLKDALTALHIASTGNMAKDVTLLNSTVQNETQKNDMFIIVAAIILLIIILS